MVIFRVSAVGIIDRIKREVGAKGDVFVVFDSCYSDGSVRGGMCDNSDPDSEVDWVGASRGADDKFQVNKTAEVYLRTIAKPGAYTCGGGVVTIICACESDQKNYECKEKHSGRKYGSLSYCISKLLDKNIPMSQWADYFKSGRFRSLKIIRPSQQPTVETH